MSNEQLRENFGMWLKEYPGTPTIGEIEEWWLERCREIMNEQKMTYGSCHKRVMRLRGKPNKCEHCGTTEAKRFEWASKNKRYYDVYDYIRLCSKCHAIFDNRTVGLISKNGKANIGERKCKKCGKIFIPATSKHEYCGIPEKTGCSRLHLLEYRRKQYQDYKKGIRYSKNENIHTR